MKRLLTTFISVASGIAIVQFIHSPVCLAQTATSNQNSTVGANSNFNQVLQNNPQVPINSVNTTNIRVPNVYPLQNLPNAYVNTENDFGMNLSVGVNTLDASNVTVYLGLIYQPGRSADHQARMARLRKETEVLEVQKKNMESNLTLLQKQIEEANLRLQKLQKTP
jgi:hypothetical protein